MRRLLAAAAIGATTALALAAPAFADEPKLAATAKVDCGTVTVTFVNNSGKPAGADVRVDGAAGQPDEYTELGNIADGPNAGKAYGDRYGNLSWPADQTTLTKTVTFAEDSGTHKVEFRIWRGPETDWYVDWQTVTVKSDCKAPPPAAAKKCEAYLYTGTNTNLCAAGLPETGKVKCADVKYRVTLVDKNVDPWGLDGSGGGSRGVVGVGCESNPLKPKPSKSPAVTTTGGQNHAATLPVTGSPVKTFVAVAAGGLLLGTVALLLSRRRRTRFTA